MHSTLRFTVLLLQATGFVAADAGSCLGSGTRSSRVEQSGAYWPWQNFETAPYQPPNLEINCTGKPLAPGYLFLGPSNFAPNASVPPGTKAPSTYIMTDTNDLIWAGPPANTTNFHVQSLNGKPVLTYWEGYSTAGGNIGHGYGAVHILDTSYKELYVVKPDLGLNIVPKGKYPGMLDLHESLITPRNTLLATAYNVTQADLSSIGGPKKGWIDDCQFYEIDIATGKILFKWSSIEHVPVSDTQLPLEGRGTNSSAAFDYFHINAIDVAGNNYLVNARHTWSTYLVGPKGRVIWTIQGETGGDFGTLPPGGKFRWQHFARAHNVTSKSVELTWFNNNSNMPPTNGTPQTDGLGLQLTLPPNPKNPPKLTTHLLNTPPLYANSQGSYAALPDGHQLSGFGQLPLIREYGPAPTNPGNTNTLWTARFGTDNLVQNYRAYKQEWHATPTTKPALKVTGKTGNGQCRQAFVSWNGATDITGWNVYEGSTKTNVKKVGTVSKHGFETGFGVGAPCVQVGAIRDSKEISRSVVVCS